MAERSKLRKHDRDESTAPVTGMDAAPDEAETTEPDASINTQQDEMLGGEPRPAEDEPSNQDILPDHVEVYPRRR